MPTERPESGGQPLFAREESNVSVVIDELALSSHSGVRIWPTSMRDGTPSNPRPEGHLAASPDDPGGANKLFLLSTGLNVALYGIIGLLVWLGWVRWLKKGLSSYLRVTRSSIATQTTSASCCSHLFRPTNGAYVVHCISDRELSFHPLERSIRQSYALARLFK